MTALPEPDPYASPRIRFGAELRKVRLLSGLSQQKLGNLVHMSVSQVSMIENGRRAPSLDFARKVDAALGRGRELTDLLDRLNRAADQLPRWFRPWLDFEREAESLHIWQLSMVPGLLQTEDYARVFLSRNPDATADQIEEYIAARMTRQEILERPVSPLLWVVLDESVLHRPVAGPEVMKGQFERLLQAGENPRITLQILPYGAQSVFGLLGSFTIADLSKGERSVAYIESQRIEDPVSDRSGDLKNLAFIHDSIRADALPRRESLNLIKETMRRWTT
ncbi:helix-turn-helix transcriptional regulator [Streptosporangium sp. NPDC051023]|uniref:helix-turn-helix domain-containing protein n=1 Tax=Streptosporangium sp. NPDC051023 TaxID=3155410 RepID=UPI003450BC09